MTIFLICSLAIYNFFSYISFWLDNDKIDSIFKVYNFFPFFKAHFADLFAQTVFILGVFCSIITLMLGLFAVSALEIETIRGNRFMSYSQAIAFALKRLKQIVLAELAIICFIGFIILLFALLGLVSRIPYIGEWIYTVLFVLPNFVIAVLTIFILAVLHVSVILLPSVTAAEQKGEAFQSILETFSTVIRQPFRWSGYTILTTVSAKIASFVYAYICFRAVEFITWSTAITGGNDLSNLVKSSLTLLPVRSDLARETFNIFPGIDFGIQLAGVSKYISHDAVAYLMACMLFIIFSSIIGYFLTTIAVAQTRTYAVIRFLKDSYKIEDENPLHQTLPELTATE